MEKKSKEGPPIYMESLLSSHEYYIYSGAYANTYENRRPREVTDFTPNLFKCRYKMGATLTTEEIKTINKRIDELKDILKKLKEQDWSTTHPE
jgi:hypothetical protein